MIGLRILSFCVVLVISTIIPLWLLAPVVVLYALRWHAFELILLAGCIDAFFGVASSIPYYTIGMIGIVLIAEIVRPHLSFFDRP